MLSEILASINNASALNDRVLVRYCDSVYIGRAGLGNSHRTREYAILGQFDLTNGTVIFGTFRASDMVLVGLALRNKGFREPMDVSGTAIMEELCSVCLALLTPPGSQI